MASDFLRKYRGSRVHDNTDNSGDSGFSRQKSANTLRQVSLPFNDDPLADAARSFHLGPYREILAQRKGLRGRLLISRRIRCSIGIYKR